MSLAENEIAESSQSGEFDSLDFNLAKASDDLLHICPENNFYLDGLDPPQGVTLVYLGAKGKNNSTGFNRMAVHRFGASYHHFRGMCNNSYAFNIFNDEGELMDSDTLRCNMRDFIRMTKSMENRAFFIPDIIKDIPLEYRRIFALGLAKAHYTWIPYSYKELISGAATDAEMDRRRKILATRKVKRDARAAENNQHRPKNKNRKATV